MAGPEAWEEAWERRGSRKAEEEESSARIVGIRDQTWRSSQRKQVG